MGSPSGALPRGPYPSSQPIREPSGETSGWGGLRAYWSNPVSPVLRLMLPSSGPGLASPGTARGNHRFIFSPVPLCLLLAPGGLRSIRDAGCVSRGGIAPGRIGPRREPPRWGEVLAIGCS